VRLVARRKAAFSDGGAIGPRRCLFLLFRLLTLLVLQVPEGFGEHVLLDEPFVRQGEGGIPVMADPTASGGR
jgi:hypothetical protein